MKVNCLLTWPVDCINIMLCYCLVEVTCDVSSLVTQNALSNVSKLKVIYFLCLPDF